MHEGPAAAIVDAVRTRPILVAALVGAVVAAGLALAFRLVRRREPLFHLALADEWEQAQADGGPYRRSTLGVSLDEQGFIHCARPRQVQQVADDFYAGRDDVVLLVVDPRRLTAEVKVEPVPGGQRFPHVYGPLDLDAVMGTVPVTLGPDGRLDVWGSVRGSNIRFHR